jgi:DNA repair ATPase RecN
MGNLDRLYDLPGDPPFDADPIEPTERILRFPRTPQPTATRGYGATLDLLYQAAEVIKGIENHVDETEKCARGIADNAIQKLQLAEKRIEELENEIQAAQACISEARFKIKESDEASKVEGARVEAAERRMCQIEMRARTAEAQVRENANAVARIEETIRAQILAKLLPLNKSTSTA